MLQPNADICAQKTRWQYFPLIFALLSALLVLNSCGSSTTATPATPSIAASCASTSVTVRGTVQCTASVANLSSTLANWQVNTIAGGNATVGTIDTNGLYTAPAIPPTAGNVVTITAVAQAQTTLTATASLTILAAAPITSISPSTNVIVASSASQAFTATVNNTGVFWYVNGSAPCSSTLWKTGFLNGNPTIGTITPQGNFTAPQIPPPGGAVEITAVSQADSTQTLCVPVTLIFGNAALQGSYAFSTSGRVTSGNSFFVRAGSFIADGSGRIIAGGFEDVNPQPSSITNLPPIPFSGSYTIGPDGRGTMQFCEPSTSNACTAPTSQFRIVILSAQQAQIIEFSSPNSATALTAASGEMDLQPDASSFNTASLLGTYTFNFAGLSSASAPQSEVGEFSANGLGAITSGAMDVNGSGAQNILSTSSYSISANGRGTATIITSGGTFKFSFYMISTNRAKFIETDTLPILAGDAFKQQSIFAWGLNSLNGAFVFGTAGSGPGGGVTDLVSFTSQGDGNLAAGSAMIDDNNAGTVTSVSSLGGTYTIDSRGRGILNIPSHTYVFYMISTSSAVIQETTSGIVAHGLLVQPQGGPFTLASLQTSYALSLSGTSVTGKEEDFVGQLTSNGAGRLTSGSLEINNFGATQTAVPNIGTYATIASNGRTTMSLTQPQNLVLYFVSPTQVFAMVGSDSTHVVASGSLYKQF